jgi:hypothetical protein
MNTRFWVGTDPQVGIIDGLGRQLCMGHLDYARGAAEAQREVYAASLLHSDDDRCDGCGGHLYDLARYLMRASGSTLKEEK